jgi:hypothetical protein
MQTIFLASDEPLPFERQLPVATAVAGALLGEPMLLSWYDAVRGIESPNGVSECGAAAPSDGVRAYAASRGGTLVVAFGAALGSATQFCFTDINP